MSQHYYLPSRKVAKIVFSETEHSLPLRRVLEGPGSQRLDVGPELPHLDSGRPDYEVIRESIRQRLYGVLATLAHEAGGDADEPSGVPIRKLPSELQFSEVVQRRLAEGIGINQKLFEEGQSRALSELAKSFFTWLEDNKENGEVNDGGLTFDISWSGDVKVSAPSPRSVRR